MFKGQEVEHRAVMPDVKCLFGCVAGDIALDPCHLLAAVAQPVLGLSDGRSGNIEYREVTIANRQQVVDEGGGTATDVNDAGRGAKAGIADQGERVLRV